MLVARFFASLTLIVSLTVSLGAQASRHGQGLPTTRAFHDHLWRVIDSYPTDGTHTYHWPKKGKWAGVTRDLHYGGERVAEGDAEGRCYCCGLTFEVFLRAWESWAVAQGVKVDEFRIPGVAGSADLRKLRLAWFGADGERRTLQHAVVSHDLGFAVDDLEDARPGDFVQIWRHSGTGHSVVFDDWERDEQGEIVAIRYWSTQKSTDGIGVRTERFGGKRGVDPEQVHIVRVGSKSPDVARLAWIDIPDWPLFDVKERERVDALRRVRPDVIVFRSRVDSARSIALGKQFASHELCAPTETISMLVDPKVLLPEAELSEPAHLRFVVEKDALGPLALVFGRENCSGLAAKFGDAAAKTGRGVARGVAGGCEWIDVH